MAKYPRLTYFFSNLAYFFSKLTYLGEFAFSIFIRIPLKLGIKLWRILMGQLRRMLGYTSRDPNMPKGLPSTVSDPKSTQPASDVSFAHPLYQRFASTFLQAFPQRSDQLLPQDIEPYLGTIEMLHTLFKEYDIIHAYATDTIFAMLSGTHPYIAYEHGTIRSIPFEESAQGRLTALSYHMADGVIVTNCDNKRAAEKLNLADYRFIPHPINEKWMQPGIGQSLRQDLRNELNSDFVIFHPARQHWDDRREPSWEKGNDILIEGLARTIHQTGMNLCAVFVEWGQTIRQSKALISKLGIEKNIKWVPPMHSANMARYIDACDLLADQFFLGAFGSTMPRALALGKPAMIYIDEDIHRWCFPEMPPVINARTPDQIYHGLKRALADPAWLAGLAQNGQKWYQKYHSNEIIGKRLISFYEDVLKNHPSPEYLEKVDMGGQKG
jgi:glycosyltransferase involved in cell wall biosynthesis